MRGVSAVLLAILATLAPGCGEGVDSMDPITAGTTCRDYLERPADDRRSAAVRLSSEVEGVSNPGNPMWALSLDAACGSRPSQTLGEFFGRSATLSSEGEDADAEGDPIRLDALDGGPAAGTAVVATRGGERVLILQAQGLDPTPQNPSEDNPGFAYEVWLYNSTGDAHSLGAQLTDENGNLQGAGRLPDRFETYRFVDVSRERIDDDKSHSGDSILRGAVSDIPAR